MARETNETTPRGTTADPIKTRKGWDRRLLKATFWGVWVIEKGFRLIAWAFGEGGG
ncbi:hypothetical protein [Jannaschia rubra]|uniref:Uncharacterized protein n=1 Tax=Jannaschia rubra TaxID=282197 RepID=A0A0M6XTN1_9RHOB|nr:hypothetical protein [Jannaschia rubra]CTQ34440.1 hypothetical protein JAN5088_03236 [Jannaschia rubra]